MAIHSKAKEDNWLQLQKFFRKYSNFGEIIKQRDIDILTDPTVGISGNDAGIHVLLDVYRFLFKCKVRRGERLKERSDEALQIPRRLASLGANAVKMS